MSIEGLDSVYRDYALAAGRLLLNWAGLEDESGTRLNGEGLAEEFVEALGNSSIPEAAGTVADAIRQRAAEDNKRVVQRAAAVYAAPPADVAEGYTEREFEARDRAMETLSEWALGELQEEGAA